MATISKITVGSTTYDIKDTTYSSKSAASGGTDVSLVTTGEKYTWNNKTSNTGTVTSVTVTGSNGLSGSGTITTSGTVTLSNSGVRSITQDSSNGHKLTINTGGTSSTITIPDNNTTYSDATTSTHGLMSTSDKTKLDGIASGATAVTTSTVSGWGYTKNAGTITGITMNGSSKGTSGDVNLGTVITAHQTLKTINGNSIVGSGNVEISSGSSAIKLTNVTIPTTAWVDDDTYEDCPYAATLTVTGATESSYPSVDFAEDFEYGDYLAYSCKSTTDGVIIYATDIPDEDIVAASVVCI